MEKVMIDTTEYQQRVLECIGSEEVNKFFGTTMFVNLPESSMCKQAMIHGMAIASMMTSQCNPVIVEERPVGHWLLLDECYNLKGLAINGNDLKRLGVKDLDIKWMLDGLLKLVTTNQVENSRDVLIEVAKISML